MLFHFSILISVDCWQIMSLFLGNAHIGSSVMRLLVVFENIEKAVGYMRHHAYCHRMDVAYTAASCLESNSRNIKLHHSIPALARLSRT